MNGAVLWFLVACIHHDAPMQPAAAFDAWASAALARVPDPDRGGPPPMANASPLPPFLGVDRATARYVGVPTCSACHPAAAAVWAGTKHATSFAALERRHASHDPRCVRCHVTGLGQPGGWTADTSADTPAPGDVGCEACHGPGSAHAAGPNADGYGKLPEDASACVACHTWDTSPDFAWELRWPQIAHDATP